MIRRQVIVNAADQITVDERSCLQLVVIVQSADITYIYTDTFYINMTISNNSAVDVQVEVLKVHRVHYLLTALAESNTKK